MRFLTGVFYYGDDGTTALEISATAHRTTQRQVPQHSYLNLRTKLRSLTVMVMLKTSAILKGTELVPVQF